MTINITLTDKELKEIVANRLNNLYPDIPEVLPKHITFWEDNGKVTTSVDFKD